MLQIATSVSPYNNDPQMHPTHFRPCRDPGCSQRVFYCEHTTPLLFMRIYSVWVYRVQGETEGDFRRGDKRYAVRILERATCRLELFG